ncbi:transmembrane protease serine 9-like [Embiotoca jacksoni]|uniref:transmembrane protease serine 9-like n=1 Tax=Embiotoca jacksoni TaxID=100190 RepID=UPI0037046496
MALCKVFCLAAALILLTRESEAQANEDICGLSATNTRIVGGEAAPEGSWPWQVSLHNSGGSHFCGGSLINSKWVMTAAHCFQSVRNVVAFLGRQRQLDSNMNEVSRTVVQVINHPNFDPSTVDNDISLLRLERAVTFTNFIRPVCLAAASSTFHSSVDSWVTGWGNVGEDTPLPPPGDLMEVEVPVVGNRQCNCDYGVGSITGNMVCAGLRTGGKDACQGDSGGPMVSKQNGRWIQSGIVSFGTGCARPELPGVYTRVSEYQIWINSQIRSNQPAFLAYNSPGTDSDLSVTCPGLPPPPANTPVFCGRAPLNSRILEGSSVATAGEWPWMASLQKNGSHVCGGTLVAVDAVMSNAACFSGSPTPSEWTVVLGRLKQNGSNPFEVTLNVTDITLSNVSGPENLAVLRLSAPATLTDYIQPICLDTGRTFTVGSACWAAGWSAGRGGEEEVLQEFQTSVVNCGNASMSDNLCTGSFTLEQGDSGGPLMCKQEDSWFQAVVLAPENNSTFATTRVEGVTVHTRVSSFQSFLRQTLGTLLSPDTNANANSTSTSGGAPARPPLLSVLHLLVLASSLRLFL